MANSMSQEDKSFIDNFIDELKKGSITAGEVSLNKLGQYISQMPASEFSHFGKLFKAYGYAGVFFAVQDSLTQGSADPFYKYALGTIGAIIAIPASLSIGSAMLYSAVIGALVEKSWALGEWIAENQDDILAKIKEVLLDEGIEIDGDFPQCRIPLDKLIDYCPIPQESISQIRKLFDEAEIARSPLVLDLDGDGVETVGKTNGVYFDHDGNGFAENTGWVGRDDGLLVRDVNGNGQIDDGTELFGDNTVLSNGAKADNGFEALKDLDSNSDGVFDNQDTAWNEVKVWRDLDSDAKISIINF